LDAHKQISENIADYKQKTIGSYTRMPTVFRLLKKPAHGWVVMPDSFSASADPPEEDSIS